MHSAQVQTRLICLMIGVLLLCAAIYVADPTPLYVLEIMSVDFRLRTRPLQDKKSQIVLAVIDERSLEREGNWPWPRSKLAHLVNHLSDDGAKVIAFDVVFAEPKVSDSEFIEAVQRSKSDVIMGYQFHADRTSVARGTSVNHPTSEGSNVESFMSSGRYAQSSISLSDFRPIVPDFEGDFPEMSIPGLMANADGVGFLNTIPDLDAYHRWVPGVIRYNGNLYAPFSVIIANRYLGGQLSISFNETSVKTIHIGDISIPTDQHGRILVNYRGRETPAPNVSITDILTNNVPQNIFRGKIVIVGASAGELDDLKPTPISDHLPGMDIHATVAESIIERDFVYKPPNFAGYTLLSMLGIGLAVGLVLSSVSIIRGLVFSFLFTLGYVGVCEVLFLKFGLVLPVIWPIATCLAMSTAIVVYKRYLCNGPSAP